MNNEKFSNIMSDFKIKVILADLGNNETVKKEIKHRFGANYKLSIGLDILTNEIQLEEGEIGTLLIWNVSGENIFEIVKDLYNKEDGISFIVFDFTNLNAYERMKGCLSEISQFNPDKYPYVLIGNKSKLFEKNDLFVISNELKKFAENVGCIYIETSNRPKSDLNKAFSQLVKKILKSTVVV